MHCGSLLMHVLALLLCVLAVAQGSQYCPSGDEWYHLNGRCYQWVAQTEGWFGAEMNCRERGGQLASIHSPAESSFLHAMANCTNAFWVGMAKTDVRKRGFSWWDGSPDNYTAPLSIRSSDYYDCVYFYSSTAWYNMFCQSLYPYVCVTPALTAVQADPSSDTLRGISGPSGPDGSGTDIIHPPPTCPAGWLNLEGTCYFVSSDKANYFNAQMSCQVKGASVASVLNARQQTLLNMALGCGTQVWIGLEKVTPCLDSPSSSSCWMWMDRKPLNFDLWTSGHPLSNKEIECAMSDGRWRSTNCHNEYRYVCKK